ncbi:MAG TPA: molybdopterin-dependent oxidoreductase, partial [Acidimicrobiales bacterium]
MALLNTACPLDCPDTCTLEVEVVDGKVVRVDAARDGNPMTQGFICQKVKHHGDRVHGPERVLTPLVRTGPKGSGELREATWDEALDLVVARLQQAAAGAGPSSVLAFTYNSSGGVLAASGLTGRLWRRFGASEAEHTICAASTGAAWRDTYGTMASADPLDIEHAAFILVWGANPTVSNTHLPPLVNKAKRNGARIAVVDPRRTAMAARADIHLALRPGTDVVAALAMARYLHQHSLLNRTFLESHADGVDEYLAAADEWPLDRAAAVCDVPAADLAGLAEDYATIRPAFLRMGWGQERNRNGGSACRAVLALPVLCGHFGQRGSGVMGSLSKFSGLSFAAGDPDALLDWPPRRVVDMHRLGALLTSDELDPPLEVLFVQGANPVVTCPDQRAVMAGLSREDLFTIVHEQVLTDTARYADVVLPAPTHFEVDDLAKSYGSYRVERMRPVVPRVGQARTNDELAAALAARLAYPDDVFTVNPEAQLAAMSRGDTQSRPTRPPG